MGYVKPPVLGLIALMFFFFQWVSIVALLTRLYFLLYVDDIILTGNHQGFLN